MALTSRFLWYTAASPHATLAGYLSPAYRRSFPTYPSLEIRETYLILFQGSSIECWEDGNFRRCFPDMLTSYWREHDPYEMERRFDVRNSLHGRQDQANVFRTFQGWLGSR
ncbi:hypothetical protein EDC04DRAFT_1619363 [Pisolithus marmoratus]|nr:hypothetical protein EDC04DRAFT_1619363 [Pisolithus marmoratus]